MTTTLSIAPATRWIHRALAATDAALQTDFLGDDLTAACTAAMVSADPVLICSAALPLKNRLEALRLWRKKQVAELSISSDPFRTFLEKAPSDQRDSIHEGKMPLVELDLLVANFSEETAERVRVIKQAAHEALLQSVRGALLDCDESMQVRLDLGFLVILKSGETAIFRMRHNAVEWAQSHECNYLMAEFDPGKQRIHPGPDVIV